jgi:acetyl esterase
MPLDPDAARVLEAIRTSGRPTYEEVSPAEARRFYNEGRAAVAPEPEPVGDVKQIIIPGPDGDPLALRIYWPAGRKTPTLPALLYMHGGGWVLGDLDSHDALCRSFTNAAECVTVSVHYRLSPEAKFPAAVDDAWTALQWLTNASGELGVDPERIAVGGDSAGGNLAAVLSLQARDAGEPKVAFQLLIYPATDLAASSESQRAFGEGLFLTSTLQAWFRRQYLRSEEDVLDWKVSPLRAIRVDGVAPAFILTAEFDPLRDEGEEYGRRLIQAGIPVTMWRITGQIHGFLPMGRVMSVAPAVIHTLSHALRAGLAPR